MKPDFTIIIVNWKVRALLEKCLDSIMANLDSFNIEIIVVDNNSRDGTSEMVMIKYPSVKMIALVKNYGFAAANNMAISIAKSDYIFFLNPDTELTTGFFSQVKTCFARHEKLGILGVKIFNSDGSDQLSVRRQPDLLSQIVILLKLRNIWPRNRFLSHYLMNDFDYNSAQEVEQVMGAAMIVRKEVLDQLHNFDTKYFIWFEEVDLCHRARMSGWQVWYCPEPKIIHHSGASFSLAGAMIKQWHFNRSLLIYFAKHKPWWQTCLILLILPGNLLLTFFYATLHKRV